MEPYGELTLHEVEQEDTRGDGLGGHLDPPLEEEGEQQHSDQTLASQSCPGTLWLGLAESGSCEEERDRQECVCVCLEVMNNLVSLTCLQMSFLLSNSSSTLTSD